MQGSKFRHTIHIVALASGLGMEHKENVRYALISLALERGVVVFSGPGIDLPTN